MAARVALVTGSTSGIGKELARVLAREGHEVVLAARNETRLREVAAELRASHGRDAHVFPCDLSESGAADKLWGWLAELDLTVDVLVNNAGFATYGPFTDTPLELELQELQLNVVALTHLTKLAVRRMAEQGEGRVLNIASTAAFQPGPLMAVYYASKAYVLSFSHALAEELAGTGVTVTALCPGPTASDFQRRAGMERSRLFKGGLADAREVAEAGYAGMTAGKRVVIPGVRNRVGAVMGRLTPGALSARVVKQAQAETAPEQS